MKRILFLSLFIASNAFGADRVIINPDSNGDLKIKVNVGGTPTDAIVVKGTTAGVDLKGTNTNDLPCAGCVGELFSGSETTGDTIPVGNSTLRADIITTSAPLTPGDYDVWGIVAVSVGAGTPVASQLLFSITDNASPGLGAIHDGTRAETPTGPTSLSDVLITVGPFPMKITANRTLLLSIRPTFSGASSSYVVRGSVYARRVR
jgi:hypothetical protein